MNTAQLEEAPTTPARKRVRAYLGANREHLISEYFTDNPEACERYLAAVRKSFGGLEWVVDDLPAGETAGRPLPGERLWEIAP